MVTITNVIWLDDVSSEETSPQPFPGESSVSLRNLACCGSVSHLRSGCGVPSTYILTIGLLWSEPSTGCLGSYWIRNLPSLNCLASSSSSKGIYWRICASTPGIKPPICCLICSTCFSYLRSGIFLSTIGVKMKIPRTSVAAKIFPSPVSGASPGCAVRY